MEHCQPGSRIVISRLIYQADMIKELKISNFTHFSDAKFRFGGGLNLFIGENGTGKSQILKLAYSLVSVLAENEMDLATPTREYLERAIALKLRRVFRRDKLGRLVIRQQGRSRSSVSCNFEEISSNLDFRFLLIAILKSPYPIPPGNGLINLPYSYPLEN